MCMCECVCTAIEAIVFARILCVEVIAQKKKRKCHCGYSFWYISVQASTSDFLFIDLIYVSR